MMSKHLEGLDVKNCRDYNPSAARSKVHHNVRFNEVFEKIQDVKEAVSLNKESQEQAAATLFFIFT